MAAGPPGGLHALAGSCKAYMLAWPVYLPGILVYVKNQQVYIAAFRVYIKAELVYIGPSIRHMGPAMRLEKADWERIVNRLGARPSDIPLLVAMDASGNDPIPVSEVMRRLDDGPSRQYVSRRLSALGKSGVVAVTGRGPQTRYQLNEASVAAAYIEIDPLQRAPKPFDIGLIRNYEPNLSRILPAEAAAELRAVSDSVIRAGDTINQIVFRRYLVDFSWASSRMEGNTYSLLETRELLEDGNPAPGKSDDEAQMLRNHAAAIEYVLDHARDIRITPTEIRGVHKLLSRGLLPNEADEGRVRQGIVEIGHSAYHPASAPQVLEEGLGMITDKARLITNPYEASAFLLAQISYLQPFMDVNKRTARVCCNIPLLKAGLCPLSFFGMNDEAYINALLAYYETHATAPLAAVYRDGYRAAAERYKTYGLRLSENLTENDGVRSHQVDDLVRKFVRAVAQGQIAPEEQGAFLREQANETDPIRRDTLIVAASRRIAAISEHDAIGLAIPPGVFARYQEAKREADKGHGSR